MENIEYLPDHAVLHRVIDIVEINTPSSSSDTAGSEERILTTKGDHNPIPDRYPVNADAYLGKMIGCVDYVRVGSALPLSELHGDPVINCGHESYESCYRSPAPFTPFNSSEYF